MIFQIKAKAHSIFIVCTLYTYIAYRTNIYLHSKFIT